MGKPIKLQFDTEIIISSLIHVPFITGVYYVKWTVSSGVFSKKNQGATLRIPVKDHRVDWHQPIHFLLEFASNKAGDQLKPVYLNLRVKQEFAEGQTSEVVGELAINLAELIDTTEASRKYLLKKSKINSSLKLVFTLKRVEDASFEATPSLATPKLSPSRLSGPSPSPLTFPSHASTSGTHPKKSNLSIETNSASIKKSEIRASALDAIAAPDRDAFAVENGIPTIEPLLEDDSSEQDTMSLSDTDSFYQNEDFIMAGKRSYLKNKKWMREFFQCFPVQNDGAKFVVTEEG